tara:strand:- start:1 stop:429 length:429 start_codon:yes stop_codon:yes gene_type:complete
MMNIIFYFLIILLSIIAMEGVAILTHKYIMHGPGWFLHKSHHSKHKNVFELNDFYFIIFAIPSVFCIVYGTYYINFITLSIGIGILGYGLIYVFLHDIFVHQRIKTKIFSNSKYLKKVRKSHLIHHSIKTKNGAKNFGFITY